MCYHTANPGHKELKTALKDKKIIYNQPEIFHVSGFVRPYLPVTLNSDMDSVVPARWKLIPNWVKSEAEASRYANTLNAIGEEVFDKPSYKNLIGRYRGLLYVKGFFEPHASQGKTNDQNYFIQLPDQPFFTLGIVYNLWKNDQGEQYPTFSILTTGANQQMAEIHNVGRRMPLIIPEDRREHWLLADGKEEIQSLIQPFSGALEAHRTVEVTKIRNQDTNIPEIQQKID